MPNHLKLNITTPGEKEAIVNHDLQNSFVCDCIYHKRLTYCTGCKIKVNAMFFFLKKL